MKRSLIVAAVSTLNLGCSHHTGRGPEAIASATHASATHASAANTSDTETALTTTPSASPTIGSPEATFDQQGCLISYLAPGSAEDGWIIEYDAHTPLAEERGVLSRALDGKDTSYFIYDRAEGDSIVRTRVTLAKGVYAHEHWTLARTSSGDRVVRFTTDGYLAEFDYRNDELVAQRVDFNGKPGWDVNGIADSDDLSSPDFPHAPPAPRSTCYASPPDNAFAEHRPSGAPNYPTGLTYADARTSFY